MKVIAAIRGSAVRRARRAPIQGRYRALRIGLVTTLAATVSVTGGVGDVAPADAAAPTFAVTVGYDGTNQGTSTACPITGPGGDNTAHDSVVCTNDVVSYDWGYSVPASTTPTQVVFTQTLPTGVSWEPSNLALCGGGSTTDFTGTGQITNSGRTLTCTILFNAGSSRSDGIPVRAVVSANVPNGAQITTTATATDSSGAHDSAAAAVTVRSMPNVDLRKSLLNISGKPVVEVTAVQTLAQSAKGVAALASPITFTDDISQMPVGTTLATGQNSDCFAPALPGMPSTTASHGASLCTLSADGKTVTITLTGADTTGTGGTTGGYPVIFAGAITLNTPTLQTSTPMADQLKSFDPSDVAGQSNFGTSYEPGGAPGDTCSNPAGNNNCASITMGGGGGGAGFGKGVYALPFAPGQVDATGRQMVTPGGKLYAQINANPPRVSSIYCDVWNPSQQNIDPSSSVTADYYQDATPVQFTVQYGTPAYSTDTQRQGANCGTVGDNQTDGPWYDSIASVPGGASAVSAVRIIVTPPAPTVTSPLVMTVPFVDTKQNAAGTVVRDFASQRALAVTTARTQGSYVVTDSLLTLQKSALGLTNGAVIAGGSVAYQLTPSYTAYSGTARLSVTDTLPSCEVNPVLDQASQAAWTMTIDSSKPADLGPDGVACTADDVAGPTLVFTSVNALTPGNVPAINYHVDAATLAPDGKQATNTAVVSTPGNQQPADKRTATATVTIRSPQQVAMQKTADQDKVEPNVPISWTLAFRNGTGNDAGRTQWIDVLPYNGDARGSHFSGSFTLETPAVVTGSSTGLTFEYTSASPASVDADPNAASNTNGGSTTWCTSAQFGTAGCPAAFAQVSAVRLTVADLAAARQGAVRITIDPHANADGNVYANTLGVGRAANLSTPVPATPSVMTTVVATSISGIVWFDVNHNGVRDAGESPAVGVLVRWTGPNGATGTAVTDSAGAYTIPNLPAGNYDVRVDAGTIPPDVIPTYDLDNGTSSPNGDSGSFTVGIGTPRTNVNFGYALSAMVKTTISTGATAEVGDSVHDTVTATARDTHEYRATLYGPVAPVNGSCANVDWAGRSAVPDPPIGMPGNQPTSTASHTLNAPGCYTYGGTLLDPQQGSVDLAPGDPAETVLVSSRQPTITTVAHPSGTAPGSKVTDEVVVGNTNRFAGTVSWSLLGPVQPVAGGCDNLQWAGAPTVATGTFALDGDGSYTAPSTGSTTVALPGCYTYTESLTPSDTSQLSAATSAAGQPNETFQIGRNLPQVTTEVSSQQVVSGNQVSDSVSLAGTGGASGTFTWALLGPVAPSANGDCTVDFANAATAASGSVDYSGDGSYSTLGQGDRGQVLTAIGCYTYVENVPQTATTSAVSTQPGQTLETVQVLKRQPVLTTTAVHDTSAPGAYLSDTIDVAQPPAATTADSTLLGPVQPIGGSCAGVDWTGAPVVKAAQNVAVVNGHGLVSGTQVTAAGCYTYVTTVAGTDTTLAATSPAGDPNETVLIAPNTPTITTEVSVPETESGVTVRDSVTIAGSAGAKGSVDWQLLGPVAPNSSGTCTGVDWSESAKNPYRSGTFDLEGDTTYQTPFVATGAAGCYTYVEHIDATDRTTAVTTTAGDPAETVLVDKRQPGLDTAAGASSDQPGAVLHDDITPSNMARTNSSVHWSLLGPVEPVAGSCDGASFAGAPEVASGDVDTTGNDKVTTPDQAVTASGCYTYVDTLHATDSTEQYVSEAGLASETVLIKRLDPRITTAISATSAVTGDSVSDVVTVAGAAGATGTGGWQLLGPIAPNRRGTCTGLDWSGAQVRAAGSFDIALAATQYATDAVELTSSGCYSYVESMPQTDRTNAAATQPGDPAETVLVNDPPAPVSQPAGPAQPTPAPQPGTGDSANGSTPLAYTGAPVAQGMVAAAALLLFGTVLVIAARRRRYRSE